MDFPRAWEIAKLTKVEGHDPKCSYAMGGVLCDCHILTQHPEYIKDYGFLKKDKVVFTTQDRIESIHSILRKILVIMSGMNQGANMGDIEQRICEVDNDLSKMQETD